MLGAVGDPGASFGGGGELVAVFVVEEGCGEGVVECLGEEVFRVFGVGGRMGLGVEGGSVGEVCSVCVGVADGGVVGEVECCVCVNLCEEVVTVD